MAQMIMENGSELGHIFMYALACYTPKISQQPVPPSLSRTALTIFYIFWLSDDKTFDM